MIREITSADSPSVTAIGVSSGLFQAADSPFLDEMMANYFAKNKADGHLCIIDVEQEALGVAYYEPALATDRTWYLTMIAVRREAQGKGRGKALLQAVEAALQANGQRVLLVETSGLEEFALTRQFYRQCGYEEEARIRDYYEAGNDMVVFRKVLNSA